MIDDTLIHPPGWLFQMELLCTLSVTPAPLSLLADDFRASFAAIHGALDGIDGLEFAVNFNGWLHRSRRAQVRGAASRSMLGVLAHRLRSTGRGCLTRFSTCLVPRGTLTPARDGANP
jgi:hypothetical protein